MFISIYMPLDKKEQNTVASKKIASTFHYALNHPLSGGKAVFRDTFTYLKAALCEPRAGCWVYQISLTISIGPDRLIQGTGAF